MMREKKHWPIKLEHTGPRDAVVLEDTRIFGVNVPAGYATDGASVPRPFYGVVGRFTIALPAAIIHDLRYDPPPDDDGKKRRWCTRAEADAEFRDNLRESGANWARVALAYAAVRAFGWRPWRRGTKRGILPPPAVAVLFFSAVSLCGCESRRLVADFPDGRQFIYNRVSLFSDSKTEKLKIEKLQDGSFSARLGGSGSSPQVELQELLIDLAKKGAAK